MNLQIYGKQKCFDTKSAIRFFKERKIPFQLIDTNEKGMSKRELERVLQSVKDIDILFDTKSKLYESLFIAYLTRSVEDKIQILVDNPSLLKTPIIRECKSQKAIVGSNQTEWQKLVNENK